VEEVRLATAEDPGRNQGAYLVGMAESAVMAGTQLECMHFRLLLLLVCNLIVRQPALETKES
jgi:hypothetical protein